MNEKALIINELRLDGSNSSNGSLSSLRSDPLTGEYERMQAELTTEIKRCGIPLDDIDRPTSETATSTLAEENRATSFVQQIQEQNREPWKNADMYTLFLLRDTVTRKSKFPIITSATLQDGSPINFVGGKKVPDNLMINLGKIIDHLDLYTFTVVPQSRSGAHKNPIIEKEEMDTIMPFLGALPEDVQRELISQRLAFVGINVRNSLPKQETMATQTPTPSGGGGASIPMGGTSPYPKRSPEQFLSQLNKEIL
jgi:hypothetical protein